MGVPCGTFILKCSIFQWRHATPYLLRWRYETVRLWLVTPSRLVYAATETVPLSCIGGADFSQSFNGSERVVNKSRQCQTDVHMLMRIRSSGGAWNHPERGGNGKYDVAWGMGPRTVAEGTFLSLTPAIENYFLFVVLKWMYSRWTNKTGTKMTIT
jgi:hypothetical protein